MAIDFANYLRCHSITDRNKAVWSKIAHEISGNNKPHFGQLLAATGKINGVPDFMFMWEDGCGFIELKTKTGKLSPNQKLFERWCQHCKVRHEVAYSVEEAIEIVRKWKILDE